MEKQWKREIMKERKRIESLKKLVDYHFLLVNTRNNCKILGLNPFQIVYGRVT